MSQVHWSMGQVLLPEHFILQQKYMHQLSSHVNSVINGYDDGILDIVIDEKALSYNILKITDLAMFMPNHIFVSLKFNAICEAYELDSEQVKDNQLSLYLTLKESPSIQLKRVNNYDIEIEYFEFFISDSLVANAEYSVKLFELIYIEDEQEWQIGKYMPKCILLPQMFARAFLESLKEKLSNVKEKLQSICISKNLYDRYQSVHLNLSEIEYWLSLQQLGTKPINIQDLQYSLYKLYQCTSIVWDNRTYLYESCGQYLYDCIKLLELINKYFLERLKDPNIYSLTYKYGIYQSGILDDAFFISESKYLVYESSKSAVSEKKVLIKGFAPSRTENILLKALPGIEIKTVDEKIFLDNFPNADQVFEIIPKGDQWQSIADERVLCFNTNLLSEEISQIYLSCI
ncbi:type VI secretion system baseplate subunit TssK [Francisella sp. SYW-9]|uniref:type VI secretion system baseplate subunit TssK n=1 Tax=Francisella sp. SYW-9 TaxID=2610888 RepID=UPI00123D9048|nr:type VI secretion system baseplate subunit TssK [Francisella sp. SYW-9]